MKSIFTAILTAAALLLPAAANPADSANSPLELYFFGSATCGECFEIKNSLLFPIERELDGRIKIQYYDTDAEGIGLLLNMGRERKVDISSAQLLFFPDTVLLGFESIMANTRAIVEEYINDPQRRMSIGAAALNNAESLELVEEEFSKLVFWAVIAAAFTDSINPCAIATMVFLVSFLATQKRKRLEILSVGLSFTAAVFITYLLLGIGALKALTALSGYGIAKQIIRWIAIALAGGVGIISFIDAFSYKKTGDSKSIMLQLPKPVKMRIHKVITNNMKGSRLIIGAIITGFLVTLLEAICTGQVYLPIITTLAQASNSSQQKTAMLYLIMYNFIFVVPLIAVMIATYYGMRWNQLSKMAQKHLTLSKIILGTVMLGLAAYMLLAWA